MCSISNRIPSQEYGRQEEMHYKVSDLLVFSATDDVIAFKEAVENDNHDVNEVGLWYGRRIGSKEMGYEERTPLMIASLFGSKGVLSYILETGRVDVNQKYGSDRATALHCAVSGCSAASAEVIKLLLDASADVNSVDANGNRCIDLILMMSNSISGSKKRLLLAILDEFRMWDDIDEYNDFLKEVGFQMEKQQQDIGTARIEKKDYPMDLPLPDINNGIYSTDEFRMYIFKVKTCSRAYSHDWTECPFVHPGENARRRDPTIYQYTCVPCPEFRKGSCSKGDACEYAHGIFECWLHPAQYRTRLCKDETECTRRVCFFAHKPEELRPLYASTGSALPSPISYSNSPSASSMDYFSLSSPSSSTKSMSTPPLTPTAATSPAGGMMWPTQSYAAVPTLQMPRSRLKTGLNSRDDTEFLELENRLLQKLMIEEMTGLSFPSNRLAGVNPANFDDILGSQIPSPPSTTHVHPNVTQQLWSFSSDLANSNVIGSPKFTVDPSMNSKNDALSKRSQSFIERSSMATFSSELSPATSVAMEPYTNLSGWGSPDGKLDWSIRGDALNKMKKSYTFSFRDQLSNSTMVEQNDDDQDVLLRQESWVNSLVKDSPTVQSEQHCVEE
ncbi:zinc finger CCCH domain-containing protein 66-like [Vicia villosa]|uniref:zinc finger CCCH domain-containing protein 66-like n=1 Tax=Vicia villosa TaxID=3911 RepID=UPI00273A8812|nr:zinc finger CCCH domain-containing protein 66-like [Vicia villosa]